MTSGVNISQPRSVTCGEKRIDEMDRLNDIVHLPASVFWVAALYNTLIVFLTSVIHKIHWELYFLLFWLLGVLVVTLLPIVVLRFTVLRRTNCYPAIKDMKLTRDFYKLSDWVYLSPVMNLGFWIVFSWIALTYRTIPIMVPLLLVSAFLCALLPLCVRLLFHLGHSRADSK